MKGKHAVGKGPDNSAAPMGSEEVSLLGSLTRAVKQAGVPLKELIAAGLGKSGPTKTAEEAREEALDREYYTGRWARRRQERGKRKGRPQESIPHARLKGGSAGHRTHWLTQVKRTRELETALRNVSTANMAQHCREMKPLLASYPNALVLSKADLGDLLALPGVGPATLRKVRRYLVSNNVPVAWRVD